ncbi:hypothetical protein VTN00DRAFT_1003 [Thermoascus crustaceus]|uniref:uncharacterized protein n=1 Tax=Thermoascus crustaceus TaxID=5088 RepID=UPI00374370C0
MIPDKFIPDDNHEIFTELKAELTKISDEDVKEFFAKLKAVKTNLFYNMFFELAQVTASHAARIHGTAAAEEESSGKSKCSASSDKDKPEQVSRECIHKFMKTLVPYFDPIKFQGVRHYLLLFSNDPFLPVGHKHNSNRIGDVPIVSVEAKRRFAGGI